MAANRFHGAVLAALAAFASAASSATAQKFEAGQSIVVGVQGRYYRGTVEKVSPEGGCARVDYRWSARDGYGSGYTYPGCTRSQKIYTLEQARKQNLTISDGTSAQEAAAARPSSGAPSSSDRPMAPAAASSGANRQQASHESQVSSAQRQQLLQAHNRWRDKVGVPPLEWSRTVADSAQAWADHLAELGRLEHDPDAKYGENLFIGSGRRAPVDAVDDWGSERARCGYRGQPVEPTQRCAVAHYTQMVWRGSERLGCGVAHTQKRRGATIWVCRYDPPGNFVGMKPY